MSSLRFYIVDDNLAVASTAKVLIERAGYQATVCTSSQQALQDIPVQKPDCVLLDIMLPELDGLELCRRFRKMPELSDLKILIFSSKAFEFDRQQALDMGADGYILKPIKADTFLDQINKVVRDHVEVRFWGVRGTLPRPGQDAIRYGGNTSCVSLSFPRGEFFIFDAGTGIKRLGDALLAAGVKRIKGKIFISHPHWDHINTIPFFTPLYIPGNDFEILGASHGSLSIREQVSAQMQGVYFPITMREFGAHVYFRDLQEGTYDVDGIEVKTMLLSHPGHCLGYRVNYRDRSICYITDNELFLPSSEFYSEEYVERLSQFVARTDALIADATYTDGEYANRVGWGHSCISRVVDFADRAHVKTLYLFHHDPNQDDDAIDKKLATARDMLAKQESQVMCVAPAEGEWVQV
jgi:phosphoribosyl 1,2-cyclic phosphodiesterase